MKPEEYEKLREKMIKQSNKKWSLKMLLSAHFAKEFFMEPVVAQEFFNNILTRATKFESRDKLSETRAVIDNVLLEEFVKADLGYCGVISKKDNTGPEMMASLLMPELHVGRLFLVPEGMDVTKKNYYQSNINYLMENLPYQRRMWSHYFEHDFKDNFFYHMIQKCQEYKKEVIEEIYKYGYNYEEVHQIFNTEIKTHEQQALKGHLTEQLPQTPTIMRRKI